MLFRTLLSFALIVFSTPQGMGGSADEYEFIKYPFSDFNQDTQNELGKINTAFSRFTKSCEKEANESSDALFKALFATGACGASVATAYVVPSPYSVTSVFLTCGTLSIAWSEQQMAKGKVTECKEVAELFQKYKENCEGKNAVLYYHDKKAYCVNKEQSLRVIVDFDKKEVRVWGKKK